MLARMPPRARCPLRPCRPASAAAARKAASSLGLVKINVTFIQERASFAIGFRYSCDPSTAAYRVSALMRLRSPIAANPPAFFSHLNTNPAMYQANVGGVFNMEDPAAAPL